MLAQINKYYFKKKKKHTLKSLVVMWKKEENFQGVQIRIQGDVGGLTKDQSSSLA